MEQTRVGPLVTGPRPGSRWYIVYLVGSGLVSLALATALGFADRPMLPVAISMPLWVACVVGLSVWATRRRTAARGVATGNLTVIVAWAAAWAATVGMGTTVFPGVWPWWLGGGLVMAATAFAGAWVTHRRSRVTLVDPTWRPSCHGHSHDGDAVSHP